MKYVLHYNFNISNNRRIKIAEKEKLIYSNGLINGFISSRDDKLISDSPYLKLVFKGFNSEDEALIFLKDKVYLNIHYFSVKNDLQINTEFRKFTINPEIKYNLNVVEFKNIIVYPENKKPRIATLDLEAVSLNNNDLDNLEKSFKINSNLDEEGSISVNAFLLDLNGYLSINNNVVKFLALVISLEQLVNFIKEGEKINEEDYISELEIIRKHLSQSVKNIKLREDVLNITGKLKFLSITKTIKIILKKVKNINEIINDEITLFTRNLYYLRSKITHGKRLETEDLVNVDDYINKIKRIILKLIDIIILTGHL